MKQCPVCNHTRTKLYLKDVQSVYSSRPYDVRNCPNCDHYFTNPLPSSKELGNIYSNKYAYTVHSLINPEKKMRARKYAELIVNLGAKNALEIGCMHGLLLHELDQKGVQAAGIELDAKAVAHCKKLGYDVEEDSLESYAKKYSSKKHDAVVLSHVLEHIVKPKEQVKLLKKQLTKNGSLVIVVPNSKAGTQKLFGRYWGYWQTPIHINHFNEQSITHLLKESGLKVDSIKYVGADSLFFLSSIANRLGAKNDTNDLSFAKKVLVKTTSVILRPWYHLGKEDMIVVARNS